MGFSGFVNVLGQAAKGFGGALEDQGRRERESALRMIEAQQQQGFKQENMTMEHGFRGEEATQQHGFRSSEITQTQDRQDSRSITEHTNRLGEIEVQAREGRKTDAARDALNDDDVGSYQESGDGEIVGFDRKGRVKKTGVKTGGLAKKDRDLLNELEPQFAKRVQTTNDDTGEKTTTVQLDSRGMSQRLMDMGRPDLAKLYGGSGRPSAANPGGNSRPVPNQQAIDYLRQNPSLKAQFDAKYGAGAASRALGQ